MVPVEGVVFPPVFEIVVGSGASGFCVISIPKVLWAKSIFFATSSADLIAESSCVLPVISATMSFTYFTVAASE